MKKNSSYIYLLVTLSSCVFYTHASSPVKRSNANYRPEIQVTCPEQTLSALESPYFYTIKNMLIIESARNLSPLKPLSLEEKTVLVDRCNDKAIDVCSRLTTHMQLLYIKKLTETKNKFYKNPTAK